jgi:hypothetical protein
MRRLRQKLSYYVASERRSVRGPQLDQEHGGGDQRIHKTKITRAASRSLARTALECRAGPWQLARDWSGSAKSSNARRPTGGVIGGAATSSAAEVNGSLAPRCWRFDPRSAGKTDSRATASR